MTRTQQIRDLIENAKESYNDAHGCRETLISLLAVVEAAEAWEEAHVAFMGAMDEDINAPENVAFGHAEDVLLAAVRAYREGGEKG